MKSESAEEKKAFGVLMALPGVKAVQATRAQDSVKHYNVTCLFYLDGRRPEEMVALAAKAWPFNVVSLEPELGAVRADYLVRPDEVADFSKRLSSGQLALAVRDTEEVVSVDFDREPDGAFKRGVRALLRSADRVEWKGRELVIRLGGCRDAEAVCGRLEDFARRRGVSVLDIRISS